MQFIESSFFGLRAAVYELARGADDPRFLLLPMIHIGAPSYYEDVRAKLAQCDRVFLEGMWSLRVGILALSYNIVARRKRLGLVTQQAALRLRDLPARRGHGHASPRQFAEIWTRVPWHWRAALLICAPLFGAHQYFTATRRSIGRKLSTLFERRGHERGGDAGSHGGHSSRTRQTDHCRHRCAPGDKATGSSLTAILYGARHMGAITAALMGRLGYRVVKAEWLPVFDHEDA